MSQPPHLNAIVAKRERTEALARIVAAERMGLLEHPTGEKLPPDFWQRCLPEGRAIMTLIERRP